MKKITILGIVYKKSEKQVNRLIDSCKKLSDIFDWKILYDESDENLMKLDSFKNNKDFFYPSKGIRNYRILDNIEIVKTEYVFIVDGDDYLLESQARILNKKIKKGYDLYIFNNQSFSITNENNNIKNFYHPSSTFVANVLFSKKMLNKKTFLDSANNLPKKNTLLKMIAINDPALVWFLLKNLQKIEYLDVKSPYVRELNSETSYMKDAELAIKEDFSFKPWVDSFGDFKNCISPLFSVPINKNYSNFPLIFNRCTYHEKIFGTKSIINYKKAKNYLHLLTSVKNIISILTIENKKSYDFYRKTFNIDEVSFKRNKIIFIRNDKYLFELKNKTGLKGNLSQILKFSNEEKKKEAIKKLSLIFKKEIF